MAEQNKTISHGVVLQKKSTGVEEKEVLDTDYADDKAILDYSRDGIEESTDFTGSLLLLCWFEDKCKEYSMNGY